jgi:hypothetical protein
VLDTSQFNIKFNIAKLDPLIKADVYNSRVGGGPPADPAPSAHDSLTLAGYTVRLQPRYLDDLFTPVSFSSTGLTFASGGDKDTEGNSVDKYSISISGANPSVAFSNAVATDKLPKQDVDGLLFFELKYYAFGTRASKGIGWTIRNGLIRAVDGTLNPGGATETGKGMGSHFLVKIGAGSPEGLEEVTVMY